MRPVQRNQRPVHLDHCGQRGDPGDVRVECLDDEPLMLYERLDFEI